FLLFNVPPTTESPPLPLPDALPILSHQRWPSPQVPQPPQPQQPSPQQAGPPQSLATQKSPGSAGTGCGGAGKKGPIVSRTSRGTGGTRPFFFFLVLGVGFGKSRPFPRENGRPTSSPRRKLTGRVCAPVWGAAGRPNGAPGGDGRSWAMPAGRRAGPTVTPVAVPAGRHWTSSAANRPANKPSERPRPYFNNARTVSASVGAQACWCGRKE